MPFINVVNRLKISQLLLISHLVLVAWLVLTMSYSRYLSEWGTRVEHVVSNARSSSNPLIDLISPSAAGLNYTNVKLGSALQLYAASENLVYFEVDASSDFSAQPFRFAYLRSEELIWRTQITEAEIVEQQSLLDDLRRRLSSTPADKIKLTFLIDRAQERLMRLYVDQGYQQQYQDDFILPELPQGEYLLEPNEQLLILHLALRNQQRGSIWLFFDVSHLYQVQHDIKVQLLKEALVAVFFSVLLILWASWWIVRPIKRLAETMSDHVSHIDMSNMPELRRKDELGVLARRFAQLLKRVKVQLVELEQLSTIDALTQLGSRYYFNSCVDDYLAQARRANKCLGFLVCDLDYFKVYNDSCGHPEGDRVLRRVGLCIQATLKRNTDKAFRLGGEEFVVLLQTSHVDDIQLIATQLRQQIEGLAMKHPGNQPYQVVTISIGGAYLGADALSQLPDINALYRVADEALYRAKAAGRNTVTITEWTSTPDEGEQIL